jgi:hypothetical protein
MSDPGLFTHLYSQLRHCGELIDTVIVDLETTGGSSAGKQRDDLSRLLRSLQSSPTSSLDAALLATVLRESRTAEANWTDVADAIDRGEASKAVIDRLEDLARALETQRAEVHARIHGSYAG